MRASSASSLVADRGDGPDVREGHRGHRVGGLADQAPGRRSSRASSSSPVRRPE